MSPEAKNVLSMKPGEAALYVLAFPTGEVRVETVCAMVGRAAANVFGICPYCGARQEFAGIDHREVAHGVFDHDSECPASDDALRAAVQEDHADIVHVPLMFKILEVPAVPS